MNFRSANRGDDEQIEEATEAADGITLTEKRDALSKETHDFVDDEYDGRNARLRPAPSENGIRVLGLHELDFKGLRFIEEYCEKELDPLLTLVTVYPAHPFPTCDQQSIVRRISRYAAAGDLP